jgi:hypothetical protein
VTADRGREAAPRGRHALRIPALLILGPIGISFLVWLLPPSPTGLTGFYEHAPVSLAGLALVGAWLGCAVMIAAVAMSRGFARGPFPDLRRVSLDEFHVAVCVIGAIGTAWVYWSVTGGQLGTLVTIWQEQDFTLFRYNFDYGVGVATGRYASILAGGLSIARIFSGKSMRLLDWASLLVLVSTVFLNSRISLLFALFTAAAVLACDRRWSSVRTGRIAIAAVAAVALLVATNYSRNAERYEERGIDSPLEMAWVNAQAYLATPTQVTVAVSAAAMDGRAEPPTAGDAFLSPLVPPYVSKRVFDDSRPDPWGLSLDERYQGTVDLLPDLVTNGAAIDLLMLYGWWALIGAFLNLALFAWFAARLLLSGPVGAAVSGALLYGFAELWRIFLFNSGQFHFIALIGVCAIGVGRLRRPKDLTGLAGRQRIGVTGR